MSYNNEAYVVEKEGVKHDDLKVEPLTVRNNDNYFISAFVDLASSHDVTMAMLVYHTKLRELKSIFIQIHCLFQLIRRSP